MGYKKSLTVDEQRRIIAVFDAHGPQYWAGLWKISIEKVLSLIQEAYVEQIESEDEYHDLRPDVLYELLETYHNLVCAYFNQKEL